MLAVTPQFRAPLDPGFLPAVLWNRAYQARVTGDRTARPFGLVLVRADGSISRYDTRVLGMAPGAEALNFRYAERLLKFLLWQKGGCRVLIAGADEIAAALARTYAPGGARAFDHQFMGD
jgi:hypothetical protein